MRLASPCVRLLTGLAAFTVADTDALSQSPFRSFFSERSAPQSASYPPPSLRSFSRASSSAHGLYSPWLRGRDWSGAPRASGPVRTFCVRTCDGYYWPISTEAERGSLRGDAATCQSSCLLEARLFVLPRGSADMTAATDLGGRAYGQLETAFAYRKALKAGCGCQPSPWSVESRYRHAMYAAEEAYREATRAALTKPLPPLEQILADIEQHRAVLAAAAAPADAIPPADPAQTIAQPSVPAEPALTPVSPTEIAAVDAASIAERPSLAIEQTPGASPPRARLRQRQITRLPQSRSFAQPARRGLFSW